MGSEELQREPRSSPRVRHGHGGRAGAEGGGLCPEQGLSGLPHEVTIPRGGNHRGRLESGSDAVGDEERGAPDSGAGWAPGQRGWGPDRVGRVRGSGAAGAGREDARPGADGAESRRGCAGARLEALREARECARVPGAARRLPVKVSAR